MPHEIAALRRGEELERRGDQCAHLIEGSGTRGAQKRFQLRKCEFDRVEIGTVGRQKPDLGSRGLDRQTHDRLFVRGEVVQDDDIAGAQRGDEDLVDVRGECGVVDRAVKHGGRRESVRSKRGDHRVGLPVAARRVITETRADGTSAVAAQQIRRHAAFIEKQIVAGIAERLPGPPLPARGGNVRPALFVGVYRFF